MGIMAPKKPVKKTSKNDKKKDVVSETIPETTTETINDTTNNTSNNTSNETLDNKFQSEFSNLKQHYEMVIENAKNGLTLLKKLEKMVNKDLKKKKKKVLSGFAKPTKISNELSKFLGIPNDQLIARTEAT